MTNIFSHRFNVNNYWRQDKNCVRYSICNLWLFKMNQNELVIKCLCFGVVLLTVFFYYYSHQWVWQEVQLAVVRKREVEVCPADHCSRHTSRVHCSVFLLWISLYCLSFIVSGCLKKPEDIERLRTGKTYEVSLSCFNFKSRHFTKEREGSDRVLLVRTFDFIWRVSLQKQITRHVFNKSCFLHSNINSNSHIIQRVCLGWVV